MKIKLKSGGILKLQGAGLVPIITKTITKSTPKLLTEVAPKVTSGTLQSIPSHQQIFKDWYEKQNGVNFDLSKFNIDVIDKFVKYGNVTDTFKSNFIEYRDYLSKLTNEKLLKEFDLLGLPEVEPTYENLENVKNFYRTDALPRVLRNLKQAGVNLTPEQTQYITNLYSDPLKDVDVKMGYMEDFVGGYSSGPNYIRFSNRLEGPVSQSVLVHELHHSLRNRLKNYLLEQGYDINPGIVNEPYRKFKTSLWLPPKELLSGLSQSSRGEYTTQELELMRPLGMTSKSSNGINPIAEIGAVTAGNARYRIWNLIRMAKDGKLPALEDVDNIINTWDRDKIKSWFKTFPYSSRIGSLAQYNHNLEYDLLSRRDELYGLIATDRYNKLPFYKKLFIKKPIQNKGLFSDRWLEDTDSKQFVSFDKYEDNYTDAIKKAIIGIGAMGVPIAVGSQQNNEQTNSYKSGGMLKLGKGKIIKTVAKAAAKEIPEKYTLKAPTGIFANMSSGSDARQSIKDINEIVGTTAPKQRIIVQKPPKREYIKTNPLSTLNAESKAAEEAKRAIEDKAYEIKSNQIDLARKLQRLWDEQGVNTPAYVRKGMMRAIEINPKTSTPPPEGQFKLPYRSWFKEGQPIMYDGAPVKDWFDLTGDYFKLGPHSTVLQAEKPLKTASNYFDIVGPVIDPRKKSFVAPKTSMDALSEGLDNLYNLYFKK